MANIQKMNGVRNETTMVTKAPATVKAMFTNIVTIVIPIVPKVTPIVLNNAMKKVPSVQPTATNTAATVRKAMMIMGIMKKYQSPSRLSNNPKVKSQSSHMAQLK